MYFTYVTYCGHICNISPKIQGCFLLLVVEQYIKHAEVTFKPSSLLLISIMNYCDFLFRLFSACVKHRTYSKTHTKSQLTSGWCNKTYKNMSSLQCSAEMAGFHFTRNWKSDFTFRLHLGLCKTLSLIWSLHPSDAVSDVLILFSPTRPMLQRKESFSLLSTSEKWLFSGVSYVVVVVHSQEECIHNNKCTSSEFWHQLICDVLYSSNAVSPDPEPKSHSEHDRVYTVGNCLFFSLLMCLSVFVYTVKVSGV